MSYHAQAIDTVYKEYRFRSRLEARWAVFFDAVGLPFDYEKEGFVLDDGTKYLPDFWLPSLNMWAEIKSEINIIESISLDSCLFSASVIQHLRSCELFQLMRRFRNSQQWPVACIIGQPGKHRIWFFGWDLSNTSGGEFEDDNALWCIANGQVTLDVHIKSPDREIYSDSLYGPVLEHFTYARDHRYIVGPIEDALKQARQARFEHGEKPEVR
ncbi:MAG: hypothetical protein CVU54_14315 [Deltaproteobacteria bacterium HGW-Deltaproteobacteria-12]|jgi:hypothetical protein|nr:MAG: hypothetical protein CVU54_14315 [Deltaproteobacteria bacterium HGW-Deltaproteobacteria-12]